MDEFADLIGECRQCQNEARGVKYRVQHGEGCPRRGKRGKPRKLPPLTLPPSNDLPVGDDPPADDLVPAVDLDATSIREVVFLAFNQLGGLAGLVRWGRAEPEKFYRLWASMGPRSRGGRPVREGQRNVKVTIPGFDDGDAA